MVGGIQATDFINYALKDVGVSVIRIPVTKNEDMVTGDESLVEGTSTTITGYIVRKKQSWIFDKEGRIEGGDGLLMTATATTVNINDVIQYDGDKFRVSTTIIRRAGDKAILKSCNLFLIE